MNDWLPIILQLLNVIEDAAGVQFPRYESGKILMPESQSLKQVLGTLSAHDISNSLLVAACKADPALHSALTVAAINCQEADKARLFTALKGV